jgi:HD-like signal output (HDOD) protein
MRMANSAIYGQSRHVNSLERALAVIGLRQVPPLLAGMASLQACEQFVSDGSFRWADFGEHCSGTAFIAASLAGRLGMDFRGSEFLGGLLHDIGYLALAKCNRGGFTPAVQAAEEKHGFLADQLERRFRIRLELAGEVLGRVSELSGDILAIIGHRNAPLPPPTRGCDPWWRWSCSPTSWRI